MKQENIFYMAERVEWKLGTSEKVVSSEEKKCDVPCKVLTWLVATVCFICAPFNPRELTFSCSSSRAHYENSIIRMFHRK